MDKAIWNVATRDFRVYRTALQRGKSASGRHISAGSLALSTSKISSYTLKLEAVAFQNQKQQST